MLPVANAIAVGLVTVSVSVSTASSTTFAVDEAALAPVVRVTFAASVMVSASGEPPVADRISTVRLASATVSKVACTSSSFRRTVVPLAMVPNTIASLSVSAVMITVDSLSIFSKLKVPLLAAVASIVKTSTPVIVPE